MNPLSTYPVSGISSNLRDLSLLSKFPEELEAVILRQQYPIPGHLFDSIDVVPMLNDKPRIGDMVLYKIAEIGAYQNFETLWSQHIDLKLGGFYIGNFCARRSSKLVTASFPDDYVYTDDDPLSMVTHSGGVGYATGVSFQDAVHNGGRGIGRVEVVGRLVRKDNQHPISSLDTRLLDEIDRSAIRNVDKIVIVGTTTDVGKTTLAASLLERLQKNYVCGTIKASGTGYWEDPQLHINAGASASLNCQTMGYPTTYDMSEDAYLSCISTLVTGAVPSELLPPSKRMASPQEPSVLIVEHGGDLIEANGPTYLSDPDLMHGTLAIIICSESALSLVGAVYRLKDYVSRSGVTPKIYANVPLANVDGFIRRIKDDPIFKEISGFIDARKPNYSSDWEWRCGYTENHRHVMSIDDFVHSIF
jgi:hypothetical protein